jgi:hypothetical protein
MIAEPRFASSVPFAAVRIKCNTAKFLRGVDPLTA